MPPIVGRVRCTPAQVDKLDAKVLAQISSGTARQQDIAETLTFWLSREMPPRATSDLFRYVDQAIRRLARKKRIKKIPGHYGWKATGK